jgi:ubiquinone/menaquinone biosynthesis C-methylase UbiE
MVMGTVDYDASIHSVYAKGRALSPEALAAWGDAFERRAPSPRPLRAVDVGSGTGRFTPTLAGRFGGPTAGVEPSDKMREIAQREAPHPAVTYVRGSAEHIPLGAGSCDVALLFLVWHHVADKPAAAAELRRVVRSGGSLLIRTGLRDRPGELWWYRFFPAAQAVDVEVFETLGETQELLAGHGWRFEAVDEVTYQVAPSRRANVERLKTRSLSTFEHLSEEEIEQGFAALDRAVAEDPGPPVFEVGLLLSFTATG